MKRYVCKVRSCWLCPASEATFQNTETTAWHKDCKLTGLEVSPLPVGRLVHEECPLDDWQDSPKDSTVPAERGTE